MRLAPYLFNSADLSGVGQAIGDSIRGRLGLSLWALTVQAWHAHFVVGQTDVAMDRVAKCAKDAVRWALRPNRPIWTQGYDKRFCFDRPDVWRRLCYVEQHNIDRGLPAKPWAFLEEPPWLSPDMSRLGMAAVSPR